MAANDQWQYSTPRMAFGYGVKPYLAKTTIGRGTLLAQFKFLQPPDYFFPGAACCFFVKALLLSVTPT